MRKYFITLLLFFCTNILADTFDQTTSILNLDTVVVNRIQYNNVVLKLNSLEVISVEASFKEGNYPSPPFGLNNFDVATNLLFINKVIVNKIMYVTVFVRLDAFEVMSVRSYCPDTNLNVSNYNAISVGMNPDQVNQTFGCPFTSSGSLPRFGGGGYFYRWNVGDIVTIDVRFDKKDGFVTANNGIFKTRCLKNTPCSKL